MFGIYHQESARKKIKFILSLFRNKFFFSKSILDVGPGSGDMSGLLFQMGGAVTAIDANIDILKNINKKHPQIRTIQKDLDRDPKIDQRYDIIFHIGTLNHLQNWKDHLSNVCQNTKEILFLETAVCDSNDSDLDIRVEEDDIIGGSHNKIGSRTSAESIEKILKENNLSYYRVDLADLNYQKNVYNWKNDNSGKKDISLRRFWICSKRAGIIDQLKRKYSGHVDCNLPIEINNFEEEVKILDNKKIKFISGQLEEEKIIIENYNIEAPKTVIINNNQIENKLSFKDKKFVIVIPSYKNESWAEKNILSALNQNYNNFRIIFIDDCSPDKTFEISQNLANNHKNKNICTYIKNNNRKGALENLYNAIHSCEDDEIVLTLDGDDWLVDNEVLNYLNNEYNKNKIWMTYGRFMSDPGNQTGSFEIPEKIIKSNNFRNHPFCASHLRTFYSSLFKKIKKEDLLYQGSFLSMAWDVAMMIPMLEMCGDKFKFINKVLYIYNMSNPISDFRVNQKLQTSLEQFIKNKKPYEKLNFLFEEKNTTYYKNNMIFIDAEDE